MEKAGNFFAAGLPGQTEPAFGQTISRNTCGYQVMVKVSGTVAEHVKQEQEYALERYGELGFSPIQPELVLAKFEAREEMEETLLRWLHRIVGQQETFTVLFNNYGSMPGFPLYVRVQDPRPFRPITEGLRVIDGLLKSHDGRALQVFHPPRLVITHQVSKQQEMEILLDFSGRSFREEMTIEELVLVKCLPGNQGSGILCRLMLAPKGLKRMETN
ncbi:hypothetical protein [Flavihumibacter fluvii]|uniref:hypothetical protein n=1 Tax=Flavihumibacter fluvii TaxID=2838157 RepID=UPI001BDDDA9B|nr:hypothetical protein [Flavihumibacter fluvii]ULQ52372.1 hypothetical protein KJS93_19985 [Flavihumibacter fluvii]